MWMKSHFHRKGWAPRLALWKRLKVIREWSIRYVKKVLCCNIVSLLATSCMFGLNCLERFCIFWALLGFLCANNNGWIEPVPIFFRYSGSGKIALAGLRLLQVNDTLLMWVVLKCLSSEHDVEPRHARLYDCVNRTLPVTEIINFPFRFFAFFYILILRIWSYIKTYPWYSSTPFVFLEIKDSK